MAAAVRRLALALVVALCCAAGVTAQWGGSGPFGNEGANPVPGGAGGGGGGGGFGQTGMGGMGGGMGTGSDRHETPSGESVRDQFDPFPKGNQDGGDEDEYKTKWVPTSRPGFEVPPNIKKIQEQGAQQSASSKGKGPKETQQAQGRDGYAHQKDDEDEFEEVDEPIPREAPGRKGQGRTMDKCLRQAAHFCSLRVMQENFAAFNDCVYEIRYRLRADCQPWAEGHGFCSREMVTHCPRMSPQDTTECLHKNKSQLAKTCVDSAFYASMEEGFKEFRKGMKEGMKGNPKGPGRYGGPQTTEEEDGETMPGQQHAASDGDEPLADNEEEVVVLPASVSGGKRATRRSDRNDEL